MQVSTVNSQKTEANVFCYVTVCCHVSNHLHLYQSNTALAAILRLLAILGTLLALQVWPQCRWRRCETPGPA